MIILGKEKIRKKSTEIGLVLKINLMNIHFLNNLYFAWSCRHFKRFSLKIHISQLYKSFDVSLWGGGRRKTNTPVQKTR